MSSHEMKSSISMIGAPASAASSRAKVLFPAPPGPSTATSRRPLIAGRARISASTSWTSGCTLLVGDRIVLDDVGVPVRALLRSAHLLVVVDVHHAESLRVALGPFEVVDERPQLVALELD